MNPHGNRPNARRGPTTSARRLLKRSIRTLATLTTVLACPLTAQHRAVIDPQVERGFTGPGENTFLVVLDEKADLSPALEMKDWNERGRFVTQQLQQVAELSQAGLRQTLDAWGAEFEPYWIVNSILVTSDERALLPQLTDRAEVAEIRALEGTALPRLTTGERPPALKTVDWNIAHIGAPQLWAAGVTGEGIVVANLDSGVHFTHPALVNQYRGNDGFGNFDHNYNWFDVTGALCPAEPCDDPDLPHGTWTMGFIVGDDGGANQIGVAPGASWIAVNGLEGTDQNTLDAAQWLLAPTDLDGNNPDPDRRPHVVNNSWAYDNPTQVFRDAVQAWVAAGIFPVFAVANDGPNCMTSADPGNYPESYAVGIHDIDNNLSDRSSRGPSPSGLVKPNIVAPGTNVRSSVMVEFDASGYFTQVLGASSASSPHVAGTVALLWSGRPELIGDVAATRALLDSTAIDMSETGPFCGGDPTNNNSWGEGRLDAFAAYANIFTDGFETGDLSAWSSSSP